VGQFDVEAALRRHMASPIARLGVPATRLYMTNLTRDLKPGPLAGGRR